MHGFFQRFFEVGQAGIDVIQQLLGVGSDKELALHEVEWHEHHVS